MQFIQGVRVSRAFTSRSTFSSCFQQLQFQTRTTAGTTWRQTVRSMATEQPKSNNGSQKPFANTGALAHHTDKKQWKDLTTPEKVVTATKATTNYTVVAVGVLLVGAIGYAIVTELFGANSDTHIFGDALEKVRKNEKLQEIIGSPMKGHGEPSSSKRRRNRRIHSQVVLDVEGKEHLLMRFYVEGPDNEGTAHLEMVKDRHNNWEYKYLFVDIPGGVRPAQRIFVEYNKNAGQPAIEDK
ncbi:mitochondrial import inner membrane translocase subunit tim21 [Lobosporangium transversale]|uniref:Mitochondrial import inner membrane translocase subunit Tim21 n=1 Tax=Lobosporangium transversale TaxID=64571 RepID=A0A1Y2GML9_9FUNG|nr:TIM21-domain-containing protein [Lobosporangium transversale]KAF9917322.1 mitochondrial import inner membrane translocase subunit tim21 [Lobosporangium transversale]ORZ14347.1 TIM21-domain-containing protein [Lobosporangium transversale]|eukprot:XP_021880825.1 TIM21-domain-containing protein [Lobosporangium transversale]